MDEALAAGSQEPEVVEEAEPVVEQPAVEAAVEGESEAAAAARARDNKGRFSKAEKDAAAKPAAPAKPVAAAAKPAAGAAKPAAGAAPQKAAPGAAAGAADPATAAAGTNAAPALKPPQDWRPAAKEKWASLPREVQEEANRLHIETKKVLDQSAQARQVADTFQRTVAPYEHMFRAGGKTAIEGVGYLVQTYAALQTAPMAHRAGIISGMIRDFLGTDEGSINLLASALEGKVAPGGGAAAPAALRAEQIPQLVRQEAQRMQAEQQQQGELKVISDFEATEPEFLKDVVQEIYALVAIEKRQGKSITTELLQKAYEKALRMNTETAAILKQRDDAKAASAKALQAKTGAAAASGVKSEPAGPGGEAKALSTRDEVKRQMSKRK
ncbi:MAG TPA: hypothetical protein VH083_22510 [Myxococcales bacterium]|nr:hypothetical protein [Myxococcales bacterium]